MRKMRIISGDAKGRRLFSPKGINLRPTSDKVREALFNILALRIPGASFLDLYAGSGAVGMEAISRGAKRVVFVEKNKTNLLLLKKNLSLLHGDSEVEVFEGTVFNFLKRNKNRFDMIFVDPPYAEGGKEALQTLRCCDTVQKSGLVIIEHFHKTNLPDTVGDLSLLKQYRYGGTALTVYVKNENGCGISGHI